MPGYQSFSGQNGNSDSMNKWKALQLGAGEIAGKRVLDLGCNEGFFCLQAASLGATKVLGLDANQSWITLASKRLTEKTKGVVSYECRDWGSLKNEPTAAYDVILFLSAFHYVKPASHDELIREIHRILAPGGLLVLEVGIVPRDTEEWVTVKRARDTVIHGTQKAFRKLLVNFSSVKLMGSSVKQGGDPINRHVFHCTA